MILTSRASRAWSSRGEVHGLRFAQDWPYGSGLAPDPAGLVVRVDHSRGERSRAAGGLGGGRRVAGVHGDGDAFRRQGCRGGVGAHNGDVWRRGGGVGPDLSTPAPRCAAAVIAPSQPHLATRFARQLGGGGAAGLVAEEVDVCAGDHGRRFAAAHAGNVRLECGEAAPLVCRAPEADVPVGRVDSCRDELVVGN